MAPRGFLSAVACIAMSACSPFGDRAYSCTSDSQCDVGGTCTSGFCAAADSTCDSGYRFGNAAGGLSNSCVGGTPAEHDASPEIDAKIFHDAPAPDVTCFGTGIGKTCFMNTDVPTQPVSITTAIDTDGAMCSTVVKDDPPWCVIAGTDVLLTGTINVTGSKPLVLVATTGTLSINNALDLASHRGGQTGAAAASGAACDAGTPPNNNGGGAGGSYGAKGGTGGNNGGTPGNTKTVDLRGGCAGQDGKSGTFGKGGAGGGAVYLIATTKIVVGGSINASGASGSAGVTGNAGGGAGGSGGFIGLDSPIVMNGGAIFANGGGGAEGSGNTTKGNDGNESANGAAAGTTACIACDARAAARARGVDRSTDDDLRGGDQ
ncbi:MAG TPA: hypothetical protein VGC41_29575, partial [Kofleriaceae bacterium]